MQKIFSEVLCILLTLVLLLWVIRKKNCNSLEKDDSQHREVGHPNDAFCYYCYRRTFFFVLFGGGGGCSRKRG